MTHDHPSTAQHDVGEYTLRDIVNPFDGIYGHVICPRRHGANVIILKIYVTNLAQIKLTNVQIDTHRWGVDFIAP